MASSAPPARFFITAAKGTEPLLRDELYELRLPRVRADRGGVHFGQSEADAYRACLWSRIGLRVHEELASFDCPNEDALYDGVKAVDWSPYIDLRRTLAVRAACRDSHLTHTQYIAQRTKDAIVDQLRQAHGARPDVDREDADLWVFVHLVKDRASVYVDYSGASLHTRGLRSADAGPAPIKENLAAALVRFCGWDGNSPLVDPMCGAGTLLVEAALWARRKAPGLGRERFGFERWPNFDATRAQILADARAEARAAERPLELELHGSDVDPEALRRAKDHAQRAGIELSLRRQSLAEARPASTSGSLLVNPPYGERLEQTRDLARDLDQLIRRFPDYERALIVPRGFPTKRRPSQWLAVWNGPIACEFRRYSARERSEA
jgi:23S rRNA G2445 N2-methylase RlmL